MKKTILLLLILCFSFSSCEKDDICDGNTPTTPRLVITFYDINNTTETKIVTNLRIIADGMEEPIIISGSELINNNTVSLPLRTTTDVTTYHFTLNYGSTNVAAPANEDILTFNYKREEIFVSRACGFKTNFTLDPASSVIVPTEPTTPDTLWMRYVATEQFNIANENETHVKIYF